MQSGTQQPEVFQQHCPAFLINEATALFYHLRGPLLLSSTNPATCALPWVLRTKGCCQQLKAEAAGTAKINHPSISSSLLCFEDSPLILPSHMEVHITEKQPSPTHQLVAPETINSSYSPYAGAPEQIPGERFPRSNYELAGLFRWAMRC